METKSCKAKKIIPVICSLAIAVGCFAQHHNSSEKKAGLLYNEAKIEAQLGDRSKAIMLLKEVLRSDTGYYMAYFGLADIYHETGERQLEMEALINGTKTGQDQFPKGYKYLAELLYADGEYAGALKNMENYGRLKKPLSVVEERLLGSCRFAANAVSSPVPYQPENAGAAINTSGDEYWPSLNGEANTLVFTRLVKNDSSGIKLPYPQEDFYISKKGPEGWRNAIPLGPPINTDESEGAQCISADGRLLFFTGCNLKDGLGSCDIYITVRQKDRWSDPVNLGSPVNSSSWDSQPSISADGQWLYFASNRKGGRGKMDIWRAKKVGVTPEGLPVYGNVANLEMANTPGHDLSPFIHADGKTLYFASDFWPGMGGKDLFFVRLDTITGHPQNLGYPINTKGNEDGLVVEVSGEKAWFTSDQAGFGGKDIFSFLLPEQDSPQPVSWVKGRVTDKLTGHLLPSRIDLKDLVTNQLVQHLYPFENEGEFLFCLPSGHNYGLNIAKEGYLFHSENFDLLAENNRQQPLNLDIKLEPIAIGKTTILKNIFFETDSFRLKPESREQLIDIVDFMKNNPRLSIEIGGHTDNRGSESYNLVLSAKRADAVVKYLISKGIHSLKLNSKGYGLSTPIADNSTDGGRAQNRRTEFKILGVN